MMQTHPCLPSMSLNSSIAVLSECTIDHIETHILRHPTTWVKILRGLIRLRLRFARMNDLHRVDGLENGEPWAAWGTASHAAQMYCHVGICNEVSFLGSCGSLKELKRRACPNVPLITLRLCATA